VVLNLAVNARDAMPQGGTITITATAETVPDTDQHPAALEPGRYVRITVADTGAGMDAATQRRAFEPFFTTKPVGQGSGLGLSMVQGVAEQSGGGVAIDSAPGRGTTISVWLPYDDAEARVPVPARLLLVEDDAAVRQTTAAALEQAGYDVAVAACGEAALELLRDGPPPHLLIVDLGLGLGGMGGAQVVAEALRIVPSLPVLIATGAGEQAVALGYPVLAKPFRAADLRAKVAALLQPAG